MLFCAGCEWIETTGALTVSGCAAGDGAVSVASGTYAGGTGVESAGIGEVCAAGEAACIGSEVVADSTGSCFIGIEVCADGKPVCVGSKVAAGGTGVVMTEVLEEPWPVATADGPEAVINSS